MEGDSSFVQFTNQPVIGKKKEVTKKKQTEKKVVSNGKEVKKRKDKNEKKLLDHVAGKSGAESTSVELIESQEAKMGFTLFGGIDKEVEEGARNIMSQDFRMLDNDEQSASADKLIDRNVENHYNVTEPSSAVVLSLSKQDSVGESMCSEPLTRTEEVEKNCNEVLSLAKNCDYNYEGNSDSGDSDEDTVACAGSEEYVFPTPEEADSASRPEIGMVFSTLDDSIRFANVYARLNGFALIKGRNYKNRKLYFQCNKSRKRPSANTGLRKRKRNIIEGTNCPMNIIVKLVDDKWHIASVSLEHNHDLVSSPSLTKIFLSHRNMNEAEIMLFKLLQEHRVKPRRIMSIFRRLFGGKLGNITFDVKKLDNLKQGERIRKENTDIEWTLQYIEKLQIDTPGFYYKMQRDTDNTVLSIFWTDARS